MRDFRFPGTYPYDEPFGSKQQLCLRYYISWFSQSPANSSRARESSYPVLEWSVTLFAHEVPRGPFWVPLESV